MNYNFINCGKLIDITGKKYSNMGITKCELCKLLGIEKEIIDIYSDWFLLDNKFYYYKNEFIFRELLMSELFQELKVSCVDFKLVKKNGRLGIVSESYRNIDKNYYMYNDFCLRYFNCNISNLIDFRKFCQNVFGTKKTCLLMDDLFGMLAMDLFSGQVDRGEYNFFFECDKDNVRLAPLCDNGACLFEAKKNLFPFGEFSLISKTENDIYSLLRNDMDFYFKLESLLDIDISFILDKVAEKNEINIDNGTISFVLNYFNVRKNKINKCLKICQRK